MAQADVTSLGDAFLALEECKVNFRLEEYGFTQTTLEQVFLRFAREQEEEETLHIG